MREGKQEAFSQLRQGGVDTKEVGTMVHRWAGDQIFPLAGSTRPGKGTTMPSHQMQFTNFLIYCNHGVSDLHFPPVCELLFKDDAISRGVNTTSAINDRAASGA